MILALGIASRHKGIMSRHERFALGHRGNHDKKLVRCHDLQDQNGAVTPKNRSSRDENGLAALTNNPVIGQKSDSAEVTRR